MISQLDLGDIQGNIVKAYGRFGFPVARHVFYNIGSAEVGRQFVTDLTPLVQDEMLSPLDFALKHVDRLRSDVAMRLKQMGA